jgi:tape measure domain-containing protein
MMMADNPKITVEVEAKGVQQAKAQTNDYKKALDALVASGNLTNLRLQQIAEQTKKVENATSKARKETSILSNVMDDLKKAVVAYVSINTVKYIADTADKMRMLEARTINASKSIALGTQNFKELKKIAGETGVALESTVQVFNRGLNAKNSIGATNKELLILTETVNKLGVLSGASGEAIKNSQMQFAQAMAGGIVRAEEFNSMQENTQELVTAIAEGMGVSVGKLRLMVIEGKLLSKDVFDALIKQSDKINKDFDKMPLTFGRLKMQAEIAFASLVADIDKATDASGSLLRSFDFILKSVEASKKGWITLGNFLVVFFRTVVNVVQALIRSALGGISFLIEESLRKMLEVGRAANNVAKMVSFGKLSVPTGDLEFALDVAKTSRRGFFKDAGTDFQQIANEFKARTPQAQSRIPDDTRGTIETPLSKTGKGKGKASGGKSEAQQQADQYADALKGLKEKARDAMLEVQGMDKSIQALASGGIKAYETQLKQNEGLGRYNELMGDYLGKGKQELELLAQSIVKREQDTEAKKKQLELSVSLKQASEDLNIEEQKARELREAFLVGGEKALELKRRELDIEQRKRDLLKDSNANADQKQQAQEQATREQALKDYTNQTQQMADRAKEASEGIRNALRSAFDNTLTYMLNGTASFKEIMVGLLRQIAVQLIKVYALQLITGFIGGHMTGGKSAGANAGIFDKIGGAFGIDPVSSRGENPLKTDFQKLQDVAGIRNDRMSGRAGGGFVSANTPYMVGEVGREMFVPRSAGNIIPSHVMPSGGGGGVTVINNVTVNTQGGGKDDKQGLLEAGKQISDMIETKVRQVLKTESRHGGMLQRGFA